MKKRILSFGVSSLLLISLVSFLGLNCSDEATPTTSTPPTSIVATPLTSVIGSAATMGTAATFLTLAQLDSLLKTQGPFTVLVPVNEAFQALDTTTLKQLRTNLSFLQNTLKNHIIAGKFTAAQLVQQGSLIALSGNTLHFKQIGDTVFVNDSIRIVEKDHVASNGIAQGINKGILQ